MKADFPKHIDRREFLRVSGFATLAFLGAPTLIESATPTVTLLLTNTKVITVDPKNHIAQTMAAKDGKILEVGGADKISRYIRNTNRVSRSKTSTLF